MPASRGNSSGSSNLQPQPPTIRDHLSPSKYGFLFQYYTTAIQNWWNGMGVRAKRITIGLGSIYFTLFLIALWIGPETIFNYTAKVAVSLSHLSFGKPLILIVIIILSFPPTVGYGSAIGICGLAYGAGTHSVWEGWSLASVGSLSGSTVSFFVLRHLMRRWRDWDMIKGIRDDKRWKAMEMAVRARGMFMVILIRFCPFPFCYSNLFFASMESVSYFQFLVSTALITPKLLIHVFLGARMFELMDRDSRKELDGTGKFVNGLYVVIGSLVGMATSYYVYSKTQEMLKIYEFSDDDQELGLGNGRQQNGEIVFDSQSHNHDNDDLNRGNARQNVIRNNSSNGRKKNGSEYREEEISFIDRVGNPIERDEEEDYADSSKRKGLQGAWDL